MAAQPTTTSVAAHSAPNASTNRAANVGTLDPRALQPGLRVRVTQQVVRQGGPENQPQKKMGVGSGAGTFTGTVEGTIVQFTQQKTGSWYAHSRDGKLWMDRLELRKPDGELIVLNIDQYTHVEVLR